MAVTDGKSATNGAVVPTTTQYDTYHHTFTSEGLPYDRASWMARAAKVAEVFAKDAAQRDIEQASPFGEVSLLKSSGLTKVLGPRQYGGGGQGWDVGYQVIREVAKGDGYVFRSLAHKVDWTNC